MEDRVGTKLNSNFKQNDIKQDEYPFNINSTDYISK